MKTRIGFVSNSSSSNFIISFSPNARPWIVVRSDNFDSEYYKDQEKDEDYAELFKAYKVNGKSIYAELWADKIGVARWDENYLYKTKADFDTDLETINSCFNNNNTPINKRHPNGYLYSEYPPIPELPKIYEALASGKWIRSIDLCTECCSGIEMELANIGIVEIHDADILVNLPRR